LKPKKPSKRENLFEGFFVIDIPSEHFCFNQKKHSWTRSLSRCSALSRPTFYFCWQTRN